MKRPFIITVASEKGGVGKTTIATNLAVYLKALREDLPVTIASFDNHFSVDQMFAIGSRTAGSITDLLNGRGIDELVMLGEYGVQFLASERHLVPKEEPPQKFSDRLRGLSLPGILILDTRPILDWFTQGALLAADLVLVPVKDRVSLVNVASIKALLEKNSATQKLWILPSLVDARAKLNAGTRVKDFLVFAARERDYQVVDIFLSKSPKVESLASGFSSRIYPVLTHARQTAVHNQMRLLAEFVLQQQSLGRRPENSNNVTDASSFARLRRLLLTCPACHADALANPGHFFFDVRSRRCGFFHPACLKVVTDKMEGMALAEAQSSLLLRFAGAGMLGSEPDLVCHLVDAAGEVAVSEQIRSDDLELLAVLEEITNCDRHEWQQEHLLLELEKRSLSDFTGDGEAGWTARRHRFFQVLKSL